jgi:hypothetical protein
VTWAPNQKNEDTFLHFSFELIVGVGRRLVRGAGAGRRGRREELEAKRRALAPFLLSSGGVLRGVRVWHSRRRCGHLMLGFGSPVIPLAISRYSTASCS